MPPRFDIESMRRLAGDKVFARGETYFRDGLVEILDQGPARVLARVSGSETYRTLLTGKGPQTLDLVERDDVLFRRLDMESSVIAEDDKKVLSRLRKAITEVTRTGGFVDYEEAADWAAGVREALDIVAALVPAGRAAVARRLAEHALSRIEAAIEELDDSEGYSTGLLELARDIHLAACRAEMPEIIALIC